MLDIDQAEKHNAKLQALSLKALEQTQKTADQPEWIRALGGAALVLVIVALTKLFL